MNINVAALAGRKAAFVVESKASSIPGRRQRWVVG